MNKTLKFPSHYAPFIIKNKKGTTTRLFDEKNISTGDMLDFLDKETKEKFATAKVTAVEVKSFEETMKDADDIHGMYDQYKYYYGKDIDPKDEVKWIHFEIV
jgi:hypothetical protein